MEEYNFIHNRERNRFELHLPDGSVALIAYRQMGDNLWGLYHTEVPPPYEGKGIGSKLTEHSLEACKAEGKQVLPLCSFVQAYVRRHPQWQEIVATQ